MATAFLRSDAHLFYEVDWSLWLSARGLLDSDVIGFAWTVPETIEKTNEASNAAVARVYLRAITDTSEIKCQISANNPDLGDPLLDDFTFTVKLSPA